MKKEGETGRSYGERPLTELSLEELWKLFPIILTEYRPEWKDWFLEERQLLLNGLPGDQVAGISHVGSTAIGSIWAKPIVDILVELKEGVCLFRLKPLIEALGYLCMAREENHLVFNKGYTPRGLAHVR